MVLILQRALSSINNITVVVAAFEDVYGMIASTSRSIGLGVLLVSDHFQLLDCVR